MIIDEFDLQPSVLVPSVITLSSLLQAGGSCIVTFCSTTYWEWRPPCTWEYPQTYRPYLKASLPVTTTYLATSNKGARMVPCMHEIASPSTAMFWLSENCSRCIINFTALLWSIAVNSVAFPVSRFPPSFAINLKSLRHVVFLWWRGELQQLLPCCRPE